MQLTDNYKSSQQWCSTNHKEKLVITILWVICQSLSHYHYHLLTVYYSKTNIYRLWMTISQSRRRSKTIIIFRNDNPGLELMITIWSGGCSVAMCWSVCSLCWSSVSTVHCRARPAVPVSACLHLWLQSVQWSFVLPSTNISQLASVNLPHQHHQPPTTSFIWYLPCSSLQCSISFISDFWCSLNIEFVFPSKLSIHSSGLIFV